jgi:hypothetical protein
VHQHQNRPRNCQNFPKKLENLAAKLSRPTASSHLAAT